METPRSEFCQISGDWGELEVLNLAQISSPKGYWMLRNAKVITFTDSEFLGENQQGGRGVKITSNVSSRRGVWNSRGGWKK